MLWSQIKKTCIVLSILAKPHARETKILGIIDQRLQVALHSRAHEGEANQALIRYLAQILEIPKSHITIQKGEKSRYKLVMIPHTQKILERLKRLFTA